MISIDLVLYFVLTIITGNLAGKNENSDESLAPTGNPIKGFLEAQGVVTDVIPHVPPGIIDIISPGGISIRTGVTISVEHFNNTPPQVYWEANPYSYYTLSLVDPDTAAGKRWPSREWLHWLVVNIPGNNVSLGETLCTYVGYWPHENNEPPHRYVLLAYEQPHHITFQEPIISSMSSEGRTDFKVQQFALKYKMGHAVACNFYLSGSTELVFEEV